MNELSVYEPELIVKSEAECSGSLTDLMAKAKQEYDLSGEAFKRSVEHMWYMGKLLTEAHAKHRVLKKENGKDQPNWDVLLKEFGISVASDYRAKRVYKTFPVLEKISGLTITEAYEAAGIPKSESKPNTPVVSPLKTKVAAATTNSGSSSGNFKDTYKDDTKEEVKDKEVVDEEVSDKDSSDDFNSKDNDLVDKRTYIDMVSDIAADMEALRDRTDPLSDEDIKTILDEVELILECAVEIKTSLEDHIGIST